jgi:hypothetical protein
MAQPVVYVLNIQSVKDHLGDAFSQTSFQNLVLEIGTFHCITCALSLNVPDGFNNEATLQAHLNENSDHKFNKRRLKRKKRRLLKVINHRRGANHPDSNVVKYRWADLHSAADLTPIEIQRRDVLWQIKAFMIRL